MKRKFKTLPNEKLLPLIEQQIARGQSVRLRVRGNSMSPTLIDGWDTILLHPADPGQIQVGDVIFFRWDNAFLMHRVVDIHKNAQGQFITKGDALHTTEMVPFKDLIARAEIKVRCKLILGIRRLGIWVLRIFMCVDCRVRRKAS